MSRPAEGVAHDDHERGHDAHQIEQRVPLPGLPDSTAMTMVGPVDALDLPFTPPYLAMISKARDQMADAIANDKVNAVESIMESKRGL